MTWATVAAELADVIRAASGWGCANHHLVDPTAPTLFVGFPRADAFTGTADQARTVIVPITAVAGGDAVVAGHRVDELVLEVVPAAVLAHNDPAPSAYLEAVPVRTYPPDVNDAGLIAASVELRVRYRPTTT